MGLSARHVGADPAGPGAGRVRGRRSRGLRWTAGLATAAVVSGGLLLVENLSASATVMFSDLFPAGSAVSSSWSCSGGTWAINAAGQLLQGKGSASPARLFAGDTAWNGYTLLARVDPTQYTADGAFTGIVVHATSSTTYSRLVLSAAGTVELQQVQSGKVTVLSSAAATTATGTWHTLSLAVLGKRLVGSVDGRKLVTGYGGQGTGRIGLQTSGATSLFDDVLVTPLGSAPVPPPATATPAPPTAVPTSVTPTTSLSTASPSATSTTSPSATSTTSPSATGTSTPTTTTTSPTSTGGPTYDPGPAVAWNPPADISAQLDQVLTHEEQTYSNLYGFTNYIFDQIMAGKGNINYCVRWDSTQSVTAAQRDAVQVTLQRQFDKWMAALTENGQGWNQWPYTHVNVKVVAWATRDRALLQWNDNSVDVYVNDIAEAAPQCTPPCGRFFHQDNDYSGCPAGAGHHYDMSLWLTEGMQGGAGGDWGQRIGSEYFMSNLDTDNVHILLHEMGHGYGLDDFYDWEPTPSVGGFIMNAGSATQITPFDTWMLRNHWRKFKSRYM